MKLSVVTSLYRSAPYLPEFYRRVRAAALAITPDYEFVLVDDGSPDESFAAAAALRAADDRVTVLQLSRNFGQHKAMMTGLAHAAGDLVFLLDCDLEELPEWLTEFHAALVADDADVVYGVQERRKGGWWERLSGNLFYAVIGRLTSVRVPANQTTCRLMTRDYVAALVTHREREVFIGGLWATTGFRQVPRAVRKLSKGETGYTLRKKLGIAVDSVTSFSTTPLRYIFYAGVAVLAASVLAAGAAVANWVTGSVQAGWTSLIASVWFIGGLVLFAQGVTAIYLGKVLSEVKQRPYTVVRRVLAGPGAAAGRGGTERRAA
jgi:putative glycosyltransferase